MFELFTGQQRVVDKTHPIFSTKTHRLVDSLGQCVQFAGGLTGSQLKALELHEVAFKNYLLQVRCKQASGSVDPSALVCLQCLIAESECNC